MKYGCLLTIGRKWLMCSLQALIQSQSVTTRHLSVRGFGGMFDPGVNFAVFIKYKLMPGVTLLKAAELLFLPYVQPLLCGGCR